MVFKNPNKEYLQEKVSSKALDRELVGRLLGYLRPYRLWLWLAVALLLFSKAIEATLPIFLGYVSQQILTAVGWNEAAKDALLSEILREGGLIMLLFLMSYVFDSVSVIIRSWIGQKSLYTFRTEVYGHLLRMPVSYFDKNSVGRLMTRTIHDIEQINLMFSEGVLPILGGIFLFFGIFVGIVIIDWRIALFVIAFTPVIWWVTHRFRSLQQKAYDRLRTVISAMNTFVQEHLMGASTIRNFGLQATTKKHFEEINEDQCQANLDSIYHFCFFISAVEFMNSFALVCAFALIGSLATGIGHFQAATFFTFSLYVGMFFRPLADLAERYDLLQSAMAAAVRIFDVLDKPSEHAKDTGNLELTQIETIEFEDVWYAYKEKNWVIKGLSLSLKVGQSTALVGMTGEGKSTLMGLLLRFYDHQKGHIKINGMDIRHYTLNSLRRQFSVVLQDPALFSGTIADNIALFNPNISRPEIEAAIKFLDLSVFMERFPNFLDYHLTEQGKGLSVGERQLISLARAVVYQRPIILLDEATANIDIVTENLLQKALKKVLHEKTSLIIAHRLSTIKDAGQIYVLQEGKIAEEGSHESLLKQKGLYENLYRLQFTA